MNKTVKYIIRSLIILVPLRIICSAITHVVNCKIEDCVLCKLLFWIAFFVITGVIVLGFNWIIENWEEIWSDDD